MFVTNNAGRLRCGVEREELKVVKKKSTVHARSPEWGVFESDRVRVNACVRACARTNERLVSTRYLRVPVCVDAHVRVWRARMLTTFGGNFSNYFVIVICFKNLNYNGPIYKSVLRLRVTIRNITLM